MIFTVLLSFTNIAQMYTNYVTIEIFPNYSKKSLVLNEIFIKCRIMNFSLHRTKSQKNHISFYNFTCIVHKNRYPKQKIKNCRHRISNRFLAGL